VQPPKETGAELFERLAALAGRDGEHVRKASPRRVGIIAVRCDLDLRQEVGAEALDEVARELVPGWRSALLDRQHVGPPDCGRLASTDRRSVPCGPARADGETRHGCGATVSTSANAVERCHRHDGPRRSDLQGGTVSSTAIEAPRAEPTATAGLPASSERVTPIASDRRPAGVRPLDQRLAIRHQLLELAELEDDRVERAATMGPETLAAYDVGVRDAVHDALAKLANGTYGRCETCDRPIPAARLEAVPYARHCLDCQERMEDGWDQVRRLVGGVVRTFGGEPQGPSEAPAADDA
jgi:RNA polymerase-binding transcription factor DksA